MAKRIERICKSCSAAFWIESDVIYAVCRSCGWHNDLIKSRHAHGSKTVRDAMILKRRKKSKFYRILEEVNKMTDVDIIASMNQAAQAIQKVVTDVRKAADAATVNINKMQAQAVKTMADLDKTLNQKFVAQDEKSQKNFKSLADEIAGFRSDHAKWAKRVNADNANFQAFVREHLEKHLEAGEIFREAQEVKKE